MRGLRLGAAGLALAILAGSLTACVSGQPGKVYDYSKAGFTPDHSR